MRLVFMGTPDFARVSLEKLLKSDHEVAAVVTVPDKPKGRGLKLWASPVKQLALASGLPILQPQSLKDADFIAQLKTINADLFVVVAFRILPPEVFTIPPKGTINLHASLLPKYRGAAPINWAIINGETETGVTTIVINERVDQGNILLQRRVSIHPDMTAGELHDVLAEVGAELLIETVNQLSTGNIEPKVQEPSLISKAPKISKEICHLNFNQPASRVHNWIRGLSPYPGAFAFWQDKLIKLFRSQPLEINYTTAEPGTIVKVMKNAFSVSCASGIIDIFEVQLQGKKRMSVRDFLNGQLLEEGQRLL